MKMLKSKMKIVALAVGLTTLASCSYDIQKSATNSDPGDSKSSSPVPTNPSEPSMTAGFDVVFQSAISTSCFGCHKAPRNAGGLNFEKYENVFEHKDEIAQAVSSKFMPEGMGRTMSDSARQLLLTWLADGAPREPQVRPAGAPAVPVAAEIVNF